MRSSSKLRWVRFNFRVNDLEFDEALLRPCGEDPADFQLVVEHRFLGSFALHLTVRDSETWELLYFKVYKSQIRVIEQALEIAVQMLGTDRSRGYCLEMICADFLAGAQLQNEAPDALLLSVQRLVEMLPPPKSSRSCGRWGQRLESFLSKAKTAETRTASLRKAATRDTAARRVAMPKVRESEGPAGPSYRSEKSVRR
jgi:hypothetical protein